MSGRALKPSPENLDIAVSRFLIVYKTKIEKTRKKIEPSKIQSQVFWLPVSFSGFSPIHSKNGLFLLAVTNHQIKGRKGFGLRR